LQDLSLKTSGRTSCAISCLPSSLRVWRCNEGEITVIKENVRERTVLLQVLVLVPVLLLACTTAGTSTDNTTDTTESSAGLTTSHESMNCRNSEDSELGSPNNPGTGASSSTSSSTMHACRIHSADYTSIYTHV
jgi:hypothetical protein